MKYRAGIDIGGTFTDLVLMGEDGSLHAEKLLTTPDDFGRGIAEGLATSLATIGAAPDDIEVIVHGTTVATNAILEAKGARTGLWLRRAQGCGGGLPGRRGVGHPLVWCR